MSAEIEIVSDCCSAPVYENTDVCRRCREHCTPMTLGEIIDLGDGDYIPGWDDGEWPEDMEGEEDFA
jgi:hypothetical protein